MKISLIIGLLFVTVVAFAQEGEVMKGNRFYKEGNYDKAEESYKKALSKKENLIARYNLGNTLYKKEVIEDAVKSFDEVIASTEDRELKTKALYNKGVLLHKNNQLADAIESYKQALRLTPDDEEVRKNLQLALRQKKQQEPKEQEQKKEQKKQQQKQEPEKKKEEPKPQQPKPQKSKLTKKQAEQYLKALEQKEKELQEKVRKRTGAPNQPEKDW